jgi:hypothetical protein
MLCVDGSSRSSYLKDFIFHGCFLRRWWIVIDFYCLLIPRTGLRLKFQDHCESVDSVCNWLFWLERAFMAYWDFEGNCRNFSCFCVWRRCIRLFKCLVKFWHASFLMLYAMFQHWDTSGMLRLIFQHRANDKHTEQGKYKWQKYK